MASNVPATTGLATGWLDRRAYPDLHPAAERALRSAALCWQAYGYVSLRSGHESEGRAALERLSLLDVMDQTKTRVLLDVIATADRPED